jgi:hypothetical protein
MRGCASSQQRVASLLWLEATHGVLVEGSEIRIKPVVVGTRGLVPGKCGDH